MVVKQGPRWIAELAYDPPAWAVAVVILAMVAVIGLAALGAHRNGGIDKAVALESVSNVVWVGSIWAAAMVVSQVSPLGYAADIVIAVVVGGAVAYFLDLYIPTGGNDYVE